MDNSGFNLDEKLNFISIVSILSQILIMEFIGTLLERKVIVLPFKSGYFRLSISCILLMAI